MWLSIPLCSLYRYLSRPLCRILLRPVEEVFTWWRRQLRYGLHHRLLWPHHHSRKREPTTPHPHTTTHPAWQYCILTIYRVLQATLYTPPGMTVREYLNLPWPTLEVVRWATFQFQIVVADVVMVPPLPQLYLIVCGPSQPALTGLPNVPYIR